MCHKDFLKALRLTIYRDDSSLLRTVPPYNLTKQIKNMLGINTSIKRHSELKALLKNLEKKCASLPEWERIRKDKSFNDVKLALKKQLQYDVKARSWTQLKNQYLTLQAIFTPHKRLSPEELYNKNSARSFKASSKLEGIKVSGKPKAETKEQIIARVLKKRNKS